MVQPVTPEPPAILTSPVDTPAILTAPEVPASKASAEVPPAATDPAPAKVKAVAEVAMVSIEATPVKAPPVVTFNPPADVKANVPVALPITISPVEVPRLVVPAPEEFKLRLVVPVILVVVADSAEVVPPVAEKLPVV